jgi:hypothetical protein
MVWLLQLAEVSTTKAQQVLHVGSDEPGALQTSGVSVTSLQLILAPSKRKVLALQDSQIIYLGDQPGSTFNIKAYVSETVRSVRFA